MFQSSSVHPTHRESRILSQGHDRDMKESTAKNRFFPSSHPTSCSHGDTHIGWLCFLSTCLLRSPRDCLSQSCISVRNSISGLRPLCFFTHCAVGRPVPPKVVEWLFAVSDACTRVSSRALSGPAQSADSRRPAALPGRYRRFRLLRSPAHPHRGLRPHYFLCTSRTSPPLRVRSMSVRALADLALFLR